VGLIKCVLAINKIMKFIDNDKEHHQVLYELGILDDEEDWNLYCKMQGEFIELTIDSDTWCKYTGLVPRKVPNN
jgi:hypothetical protein